MNKFPVIFILFILLIPLRAIAAIHYVSGAGGTNWAASTAIETPCNITTAFSNAAAGDLVYLRGGDLTVTSSLSTSHSGSGDAEENRIIFKAYPGETPVIVSNSLGSCPVVYIDHQYITFDGISFESSNLGNGWSILYIGNTSNGYYTDIVNCTFSIFSYVGTDNTACITLQSTRAHYAYVYNCTLIGPGGAVVESRTNFAGIIYSGGGNVGSKVLKNDISGVTSAIYSKHANADTAISGAEIAYNYLHDNYADWYGNPVYINFHDNLCISPYGIDLGDNGGGAQGNNNTINHNTVTPKGIYLKSPSEGPITGCIITNNIFKTKTTETYYGDTESLNTWDYNMYGDDSAIGAHDLGTTNPTFVGGGSPSSISDYALTTESAGYQACADSTDMGADVSLVGVFGAQTQNHGGGSFSGMGNHR